MDAQRRVVSSNWVRNLRANGVVLVLVAVLYAGYTTGNHYAHRHPVVGEIGRIVMFLAIAAVFSYGALVMTRQKELERAIFLETSTVAFYATMAAALVFGSLAELHVVHTPSPWAIWTVGSIVWFVVWVYLVRRRT
jgi:membrane protein DedA with SNARE-associated domain